MNPRKKIVLIIHYILLIRLTRSTLSELVADISSNGEVSVQHPNDATSCEDRVEIPPHVIVGESGATNTCQDNEMIQSRDPLVTADFEKKAIDAAHALEIHSVSPSSSSSSSSTESPSSESNSRMEEQQLPVLSSCKDWDGIIEYYLGQEPRNMTCATVAKFPKKFCLPDLQPIWDQCRLTCGRCTEEHTRQLHDTVGVQNVTNVPPRDIPLLLNDAECIDKAESFHITFEGQHLLFACTKISSSSLRAEKYCQIPRVQSECRVSCDSCPTHTKINRSNLSQPCQDSVTKFVFTREGVRRPMDCVKVRRATTLYCVYDQVSHMCPVSCGVCDDSVTQLQPLD